MFNLFNWGKKPVMVDDTPIPKSFTIRNDHQLLNINMAVEDDLVDITIKPLTYAEAAMILKDKPTKVIKMNHPSKKIAAKVKNREVIDDTIDNYDKYNHYEKNISFKKKHYIHLQNKKIQSQMRKQLLINE